jgi:excisionase family DNA binding protein
VTKRQVAEDRFQGNEGEFSRRLVSAVHTASSPAGTASNAERDDVTGIFSRRLASVPQVAAILGVSARTVWNWVYLRKLPVYRIGTATVRIDLTEIETLLNSSRIPAAGER